MWHLENFSDEKLLDIVENYERYKYEPSVKYEAEAILKKRGIDLKKSQHFHSKASENYQAAKSYLSQYKFRAIVCFVLFLTLIGVQFIVNSYATLLVFGVLLLIYIMLVFSCYFSHRNFFKSLKKENEKAPLVLFFLLGFLFFPIYSIYQASRMNRLLPRQN